MVLIDGDQTTVNSWSATTNGETVVVEFDQTYGLDSINIVAANLNSNLDFSLALSIDGINFFPINIVTDCLNLSFSSAGYECELRFVRDARFLRLGILQDIASIDVYEIEAIGGSVTTGPSNTITSGVYFKECGPLDPQDLSDLYYTNRITFSGNQFISENDLFEDSSCSVPYAPEPIFDTAGTFTTGSLVTTTEGIIARALNVTTQTVNGSPQVETEYTLYYFNGTDFYLGDTLNSGNDGTSPANRPTTLEYISIYREE